MPALVREAYNCPSVVAHRVIKVNTEDNVITFETKGDNVSGPDPFTVRAIDLKGIVAKRVPLLGFLLLFFQSKRGLITFAGMLLLIVFLAYEREIGQIKSKAHRAIFFSNNRRTERGEARLKRIYYSGRRVWKAFS